MPLAITSLRDLGDWVRSDGLEIVLLVVGSVLMTRLVSWVGAKVTAGIDAQDQSSDLLVRSEAAKHRHALTQVITWVAVVLIYLFT